jgi:hypothetical protein
LYVKAQNVNGIIITGNLKIPVIRRNPTVQYLKNFDFSLSHPKPPGSFLTLVACMAFYA